MPSQGRTNANLWFEMENIPPLTSINSKCFSQSVLLTSQQARLDLWFCDTKGHSWIWSSWHSVKHQKSKNLQVAGTLPQEASGPTQSFETDTGVIDQGLWIVRNYFLKPNGPQFLSNNRIYQENSHRVSPIISIIQQRAVEWREVKQKNRLEFKIELHCSVCPVRCVVESTLGLNVMYLHKSLLNEVKIHVRSLFPVHLECLSAEHCWVLRTNCRQSVGYLI